MQKLYYSISDVSKIIDEEQHILRYWEKEFTQLKPRKNRAGNRVYSVKDLNLLKIIKSLIRNDRLTMKLAKDKIRNMDLSILENEQIDSKHLEVERSVENIPSERESLFITQKNLLNASDMQELKELLLDIRNILAN